MKLFVRKNVKYILVMLALVIISVTVHLNLNIFNERFAMQLRMFPLFQKAHPILEANRSETKFTVLLWTPWYGSTKLATSGYFRPNECANEYVVISNKSLLHQADAVIFQYVDLRSMGLTDLPTTRNQSVPWILALQESPINLGTLKSNVVDGLFDFTWSMRSDSEIHPEFVEMFEKYEEPDRKWIYGSNFSYQFISNKTKIAAWVVSAGCSTSPSKRDALAAELATHGVPIDIYGRCGPLNCAQGESCFERLGQKYLFYMAFENSLCVDYITEKPSHGWFHNMVPVIYALGKKETFAPPNSYIDALEFETVEKLAAYLKFLDENPKEYFKYFEWRSVYNLTSSVHSSYHCQIFRKIKKVTETLRGTNSSLHYGRRNKYGKLSQWFFSFYNSALKMQCQNCLKPSEVNVTHLNQNKLNVFNRSSRCI
ncbi:Alpha-(1,3)-fucosyltransferase C [Orchesella cincta]|uniref:Fucosyltransferase n=1 Tax=Orchesella cincta TaxID=48709 RepID=A0A1D2MGC1_ORCCI|nr:Alpha-(1,3)-fucosyltransferase C [Orchesella cincta]